MQEITAPALKCIPWVALIWLSLLSPAYGQITYLNDTFSDNERLNQSLTSSARWTVGAHNATAANAYGTLDASAGNLVLDHTTASGVRSFAAAWAYFTPDSAVTVPVGETLTLSFTFRLVGGTFATNAGAFRWALLNSNGNRATTDFAGTNATGISSGTTFSLYRGYEGQTPLYNTTQSTAGTDILVRERTGSGSALFDSANWTAFTSSAATEPTFALNTDYSGSLVLTRSASGISLQATLAGASTTTVLDSVSPFVAFDTVVFFTTDAAGHDLVFDNVSVTMTPEPTSLSVLATVALGLLARRRRAA